MLFSIMRSFTLLLILLNITALPVFAEQPATVDTTVAESALIDLSSMNQIGEMITGGVLATAYITALAPDGQSAASHMVVVAFVNETSGVPLAKGKVGIKHRKLFGDTSVPVWMNSSKEQPELFVAEVKLVRRGTYLFIVGSKLEDDKKRQFTFQYRY